LGIIAHNSKATKATLLSAQAWELLMSIASLLFTQIRHAPTRPALVRAVATAVMWFSAGAYVTSVLSAASPHVADGMLLDVIGGAVTAVLAGAAKLV
jgi:hypothetical protein